MQTRIFPKILNRKAKETTVEIYDNKLEDCGIDNYFSKHETSEPKGRKKQKGKKTEGEEMTYLARRGILSKFTNRKRRSTKECDQVISTKSKADSQCEVVVVEDFKEAELNKLSLPVDVNHCVICNRSFPDKKQYERHCQFSTLHEMNVSRIEKEKKQTKTSLVPISKVIVASPLFQVTSNDIAAERHRMKVVQRGSKFFWRIRSNANIIFARNELGHTSIHVFDPTQKVQIDFPTIYYEEEKIMQLVNQKNVRKKDGKITPYEELTSLLEIGYTANDSTKLQVILSGKIDVHYATEVVTNTSAFLSIFYAVLNEGKKNSKKRKPSIVEAFDSANGKFQEDKILVKEARRKVSNILAQTNQVVESLQASGTKDYSHLRDGQKRLNIKNKDRVSSGIIGGVSKLGNFFSIRVGKSK